MSLLMSSEGGTGFASVIHGLAILRSIPSVKPNEIEGKICECFWPKVSVKTSFLEGL